MTIIRLSLSLALASALAACGEDKPSGAERRTAAGEVLGGTVSDAMIPLDQLRSQAPPAGQMAQDEPASDGGSDGSERRKPRPQARPDKPQASSKEPAGSPAAPETPETAD